PAFASIVFTHNFSLDRPLGAAIAVFEQLKRQEHLSELQPLLVAIETELENFNLDSVNQYLHVLATHLHSLNPNGNSAFCDQAQNFNCG
ncbi:MAG: hypothetical protein ACK58N_09210, partial [Synechocystis sp.]